MAHEMRLLGVLQDYSQQLDGHLITLRECHAALEIAWAGLREIYEGQGAEMFAEAFGAASGRLSDYSDGAAEISRALARKIEELRVMDSADAGL